MADVILNRIRNLEKQVAELKLDLKHVTMQRDDIRETTGEGEGILMEDKWVTSTVYCNLCGYDWQAVYEYNNTTRLECPNCHGMSRINEVANV